MLDALAGREHEFAKLVGNSPAMRELYARIAKVAPTDLNVLVQGESGTGKELVARAIHEGSGRAGGPFVALNCGGIPEALVDSELFGHTKGAFTGAVEVRPGVFVEANSGTLLLDEVGELSATVQARLLRTLQDHDVRPIGASGTRRVDVRVVAATHVDLNEGVKAKLFRADLFYRLNVVPLRIPPLRDRVEDIPLLVTHLIDKHSALLNRAVPCLAPALLHALVQHPWPGNVRELENTVQCLLALNSGPCLDVSMLEWQCEQLPEPCGASAVEPAPAIITAGVELEDYKRARRRSIEAFERAYFVALLQRARGNVSEASRISGMDRANLRRALAKKGLRAAAPAVAATRPLTPK